MTKIQLMLLGEMSVGKSCLLAQFVSGKYLEKNYPTVGPEFHVKKIKIEDEDVTLFILDTSGQERIRSICRSYYRSGEGVLLVYDVTRPETFLKLSGWLKDLRSVNEEAVVLIAGNKNEDPTQRNVAVSMVKNFAAEENLEYIETSAKTGENVNKAFVYLARKVLYSKGILKKNPDSLKQQSTSTSVADQGSIRYEKNIEKDKDTIKLTTKEPAVVKKQKGCC